MALNAANFLQVGSHDLSHTFGCVDLIGFDGSCSSDAEVDHRMGQSGFREAIVDDGTVRFSMPPLNEEFPMNL
jgi:hypothetical protein